ncbi:OB-fold domain-containing protein [Acidiferrimicrobium sp. IK]|nr:OB-fold domain-containing protein [Acidiferrimicrobium sp. IK]
MSFVVSHRSMDPGWQARAPYATLVVELPEGTRLLAATTLPPGDVGVGLQVQLRAEPPDRGLLARLGGAPRLRRPSTGETTVCSRQPSANVSPNVRSAHGPTRPGLGVQVGPAPSRP